MRIYWIHCGNWHLFVCRSPTNPHVKARPPIAKWHNWTKFFMKLQSNYSDPINWTRYFYGFQQQILNISILISRSILFILSPWLEIWNSLVASKDIWHLPFQFLVRSQLDPEKERICVGLKFIYFEKATKIWRNLQKIK